MHEGGHREVVAEGGEGVAVRVVQDFGRGGDKGGEFQPQRRDAGLMALAMPPHKGFQAGYRKEVVPGGWSPDDMGKIAKVGLQDADIRLDGRLP
jgi:hypothetical protein